MITKDAEYMAFEILCKNKNINKNRITFGRIPCTKYKKSFSIENSKRFLYGNVTCCYLNELRDAKKTPNSYIHDKSNWSKNFTAKEIRSTPMTIITRYCDHDKYTYDVFDNYNLFEEVANAISKFYKRPINDFSFCKKIPQEPRIGDVFLFFHDMFVEENGKTNQIMNMKIKADFIKDENEPQQEKLFIRLNRDLENNCSLFTVSNGKEESLICEGAEDNNKEEDKEKEEN